MRSLSLAGVGLSLPSSDVLASKNDVVETNSCNLIPSETAGPFPLDLTANTYYLRQDVREDRAGVQLNLRLKIIGTANCEPMPNVRVNIWHCDKVGNYSGYQTEVGLTYLRGYQMTDANGEVEFITILPGWYNGRVCHIHFQVHVSTAYSAVSQLTFDHATLNAAYADHSTIYTDGADPLTPSTDNIFSDGYQYQLATLTPNTSTGGYDSYLEVAVQGTGTVGIGHIEKETDKQVTLLQNQPNPFYNQTTVPFILKTPSKVSLELWNIDGKKVAVIDKGLLNAGKYDIVIDPQALQLPKAAYLYQIVVENSQGVFKNCKMMTFVR